MKKILSFTLALALLFGVCVSVGAVETDTELQQKFYNYCLEVLPEDMKPSEGDNVRIYSSKEVDGVEIFYGDCPWIESEPISVYKFIGDWRFYTGYTHYPYDLGVYVSSGNEIYTLEQAYEIGVFTDLTPVNNMYSPICIKLDKDYKYADRILPDFLDVYRDMVGRLSYDEHYEYYSSNNTSTGDETTPDYVLVSVYTNCFFEAPTVMVFGDYIMIDKDSTNVPFYFGKGIYIPAEDKLDSLTYAYDMGIEGIESVFTEGGLGLLIGDMDSDRVVTIKDATFIQKCIAGLEYFATSDYLGDLVFVAGADKEIPTPRYISDFNRDGERNIKDATAIQKHIAGLPY